MVNKNTNNSEPASLHLEGEIDDLKQIYSKEKTRIEENR